LIQWASRGGNSHCFSTPIDRIFSLSYSLLFLLTYQNTWVVAHWESHGSWLHIPYQLLDSIYLFQVSLTLLYLDDWINVLLTWWLSLLFYAMWDCSLLCYVGLLLNIYFFAKKSAFLCCTWNMTIILSLLMNQDTIIDVRMRDMFISSTSKYLHIKVNVQLESIIGAGNAL